MTSLDRDGFRPMYVCLQCGRQQHEAFSCGLCGAVLGLPLPSFIHPETQAAAIDAVVESNRRFFTRGAGVRTPGSASRSLGGLPPSLDASEGLSERSAVGAPPSPDPPPRTTNSGEAPEVVELAGVSRERVRRVACAFGDTDHAFGGGMPIGRFVLIGGDRGTGKTTWALRVLAGMPKPALFVSGEGQTAGELAALLPDDVSAEGIHIVQSNDVESVEAAARALGALAVAVDSLQSVGCLAGRLGTEVCARAVLVRLQALSRETDATVIAVSQMNAEGRMRGSHLYQQLCDTIAMLTRDECAGVTLRMDGKNRGGPIDRSARYRFDDVGALRPIVTETP